MLRFFDYLYYATCQFYNKYEGPKSNFGVSALIIVALAQGMNLSAIFFGICLIAQKKFAISKILVGFLAILLLIVNGFRYNRLNYQVLDKRWGDEDKGKKDKKRKLFFIYVVFSIALSFGLAIYLGSKKW